MCATIDGKPQQIQASAAGAARRSWLPGGLHKTRKGLESTHTAERRKEKLSTLPYEYAKH